MLCCADEFKCHTSKHKEFLKDCLSKSLVTAFTASAFSANIFLHGV